MPKMQLTINHCLLIIRKITTIEHKMCLCALQCKYADKVHMILLDPTQFIVDVTNAHDEECLADVTKTPITGT